MARTSKRIGLEGFRICGARENTIVENKQEPRHISIHICRAIIQVCCWSFPRAHQSMRQLHTCLSQVFWWCTNHLRTVNSDDLAFQYKWLGITSASHVSCLLLPGVAGRDYSVSLCGWYLEWVGGRKSLCEASLQCDSESTWCDEGTVEGDRIYTCFAKTTSTEKPPTPWFLTSWKF